VTKLGIYKSLTWNPVFSEQNGIVVFDKNISRQNVVKELARVWQISCKCFASMDEFNSPENGNCKPLALIDCEFGNELIRKFLETWKDIFSKAVLLGYSKSKEFPEVEFIRQAK
jgi:hypothetical protein